MEWGTGSGKRWNGRGKGCKGSGECRGQRTDGLNKIPLSFYLWDNGTTGHDRKEGDSALPSFLLLHNGTGSTKNLHT